MMDIKYITIVYPGRGECKVFQTDSAPSGLNRSRIYFAHSPFSYYIIIFSNTDKTSRPNKYVAKFFFTIGWNHRHGTAKKNNRIQHNLFYHLNHNSGYLFLRKKNGLWKTLPSQWNNKLIKHHSVPFSTHPMVGENINSQTSDIGGKLARLNLSFAIFHYILSFFISSARK